MPRSLVTGGAGFVGSHLVDRLLAEGHEVVAVDNFYTGARENVAHLEDDPRFTLVAHDIIKPLPGLGGAFNWIFNLACPASPPAYQRDPLFTTMTCVHGTLNVLNRAEADGARFMQASTSEIYGDPQVHPQPESYTGAVNTLGPRACYDEGKRVAETLSADFHRTRGLEIRIVRIFNTYGPRMDPADGRVVTNFLHQAMKDEPLTVYGEGTQTRSFCFVDDLVEGIWRLMSHPDVEGPVNLGNDGEFTMLELADMVRKVTHSKSEIIHLPLPKDDPVRRRPDLGKARAVLGYEPVVTLEEGLRRTAEAVRDE